MSEATHRLYYVLPGTQATLFGNNVNQNLGVLAMQLYDYRFVQLDFPNEVGKPYKIRGASMCGQMLPDVADVGNLFQIGIHLLIARNRQ